MLRRFLHVVRGTGCCRFLLLRQTLLHYKTEWAGRLANLQTNGKAAWRILDKIDSGLVQLGPGYLSACGERSLILLRCRNAMVFCILFIVFQRLTMFANTVLESLLGMANWRIWISKLSATGGKNSLGFIFICERSADPVPHCFWLSFAWLARHASSILNRERESSLTPLQLGPFLFPLTPQQPYGLSLKIQRNQVRSWSTGFS